jgi:hypothetical protein
MRRWWSLLLALMIVDLTGCATTGAMRGIEPVFEYVENQFDAAEKKAVEKGLVLDAAPEVKKEAMVECVLWAFSEAVIYSGRSYAHSVNENDVWFSQFPGVEVDLTECAKLTDDGQFPAILEGDLALAVTAGVGFGSSALADVLRKKAKESDASCRAKAFYAALIDEMENFLPAVTVQLSTPNKVFKLPPVDVPLKACGDAFEEGPPPPIS